MAESEVARSVGRGGAGNFYTMKDIENMEAAGKENLESQLSNQDTEPENQEDESTVQYRPLGRGGAGNFFEPPSPSNEPEAQTQASESNELAKVVTAETTSSKAKGVRTGRGGVGNWFETASAREKREAEEEWKRKEEEERLVRLVRESIEEKLTKPQATYGCGSERGVRVGKSRLGLTMRDEIGL